MQKHLHPLYSRYKVTAKCTPVEITKRLPPLIMRAQVYVLLRPFFYELKILNAIGLCSIWHSTKVWCGRKFLRPPLGSTEKTIYISFHIEWNMIVVTFFLSILNQMEFNLVQN